MSSRGRLVYSSGSGQIAKQEPGRDEPEESLPPAEQSLHVRFERSGRKGKTVTVAGPLRLVRADALKLLRGLKKKCGGGGALKTSTLPTGEPSFVLEIQGDHVARLKTELTAKGYRVS